jgi:hypothetical protein
MNTQWIKKYRFMSGLLILLGACTLLVGSCAFVTRDREVSWEEEVPLNTGETIIVKRTVPWAYQGGAGNPFAMAMLPNVDQQILEFTYKGKSYNYAGGAAVGWIVISPDGQPNLVATAADWDWAGRNYYYCVVPFYAQFKPNADGKTWTWPKQIEPWLYGQTYNLMANTHRLNERLKIRYAAKDRVERDTTYAIQQPEGVKISSTYKETCPEDPATWNLPKPTWSQK